MQKAIIDMQIWTKDNSVRIADVHYTINEEDVKPLKLFLESLEKKREE